MMFYIIVFIIGLVIGSFLNVCICRLPKNESIIKPSSHCPHCHKPISWYDNIPLISYLFLRGRCRSCGRPISFEYFIVELLTGLVLLGLFAFFRDNLVLFLIYSLLSFALIVASFIDLRYKIIPDEITLSGIAIGLLMSIAYPPLQLAESWYVSVVYSLAGIMVGGLSIYLIGLLGNIMFKKESMGAGDVKLMAMAGAFIGWKLILLAFFLAPLFGSIAGIIVKIKTKEDIIPYGPFLSFACLLVIFVGENIISYLLAY